MNVSKQNGQGLLEVVMAIGIIISGTVGSITLISATVNAGRATNNKVVAADLAREGIEVVRNLRDTNWLKIQANVDCDGLPANGITLCTSFNGIFDSAAKFHYAIPVFDQGSPSNWTITGVTIPVGPGTELDKSFNATCNALTCAVVYYNANGYLQRAVGAAPGSTSRFTRILELHPICRLDALPPGTPDGIPDIPAIEKIATVDAQSCADAFGPTYLMVGLQVVANIRWKDGGTAKSYRLEERLYNWKYAQ